MKSAVWFLALGLVACGDDTGGGGGSGGESGTTAASSGTVDSTGASGECASVPNVSDGPTADQVSPGASTVICYYYQPNEGYCRKVTDPGDVASFEANGKGAIGCTDAVIITDAECPLANATGKCTGGIDAERIYYECTKFHAPQLDPKKLCEDAGGTFSEI